MDFVAALADLAEPQSAIEADRRPYRGQRGHLHLGHEALSVMHALRFLTDRTSTTMPVPGSTVLAVLFVVPNRLLQVVRTAEHLTLG